MKNLNSLIAFALLVLVVAACGKSSNDNSSNSSNNNNSSNSNSSSSSSKTAPSETNSEGVFHDDKAGIRLQAPKGWKTRLDGEQLIITAPDGSMTMVFWVPEGSFDSAIKDLDRQLSRKIKRMKTTTNGSESSTNGMPIYTIAGTGEVDGNDIEWSVDIIKAPKKPTIVLTFAQPGAWGKHSDDIKEFVASIKPTS
jgi:outer membrane lipoprotein-sorting protein